MFVKRGVETVTEKFTFKSINGVSLIQKFYNLLTIQAGSRYEIGSTVKVAATYARNVRIMKSLAEVMDSVRPVS